MTAKEAKDKATAFNSIKNDIIYKKIEKLIEQTASKGEYRAFKDWFILTHYDDFVNLLLGEAIITNPATKNKFASGDNYMFADKSAATITSWRPDDGQVFYKSDKLLLNLLCNNHY